VWDANAIGFMKSDSNNGKVLHYMFKHGSIASTDWEIVGLSNSKQLHKAIRHISKKGYGVKKNGNTYTLIIPQGMTEPKIT
jgi:hypothetical protein